MDDYDNDVSIGRHIYHEINKNCPSRVKLKGVDVKTKLVRGTIQVLSDELVLGWHPNYLNMLNEGDEDD